MLPPYPQLAATLRAASGLVAGAVPRGMGYAPG
jgi:hypothetical protein